MYRASHKPCPIEEKQLIGQGTTCKFTVYKGFQLLSKLECEQLSHFWYWKTIVRTFILFVHNQSEDRKFANLFFIGALPITAEFSWWKFSFIKSFIHYIPQKYAFCSHSKCEKKLMLILLFTTANPTVLLLVW